MVVGLTGSFVVALTSRAIVTLAIKPEGFAPDTVGGGHPVVMVLDAVGDAVARADGDALGVAVDVKATRAVAVAVAGGKFGLARAVVAPRVEGAGGSGTAGATVTVLTQVGVSTACATANLVGAAVSIGGVMSATREHARTMVVVNATSQGARRMIGSACARGFCMTGLSRFCSRR